MAENLVLATLQVNADGTITAYSRTGQAAVLMERQTRNAVESMERKTRSSFDGIGISAKRLIDGFLNIRRLVSGLFIGFSVGGAIFAIGQLIQETITATSWFKNAKTAAVDWFHSIVLGEDEASAAIRHLGDAMKDAGVRGSAAILADIKKVKATIIEARKALEPTRAATSGQSFLGAIGAGGFGGLALQQIQSGTIAPNHEQIINATKDLMALQMQLAKLQEEYKNLGVTIPKVAAGLKSSDFPWQGPTLSMLKELPPTLFDQIIAWNQLQQQVEQMGDPFQQIIQSQVEVLQVLDDTTSAAERQSQEIDLLLQKYEQWISVLGVASGAVGAAAEAGIFSARAAWRIQQALLASEAIIRGMFEQARAVQAAVTPGEQWEVPFHQAAAALFFATAAFRGVGAIAGGGGGGGGGRAAGGGSSFAQSGLQNPTDTARESAPNQQITIIVEGSMIGSDPNAIARWLAEITNKARRDGMRAA